MFKKSKRTKKGSEMLKYAKRSFWVGLIMVDVAIIGIYYNNSKKNIDIKDSIYTEDQQGDNYLFKNSEVEVKINQPPEITLEQKKKIISILSKHELQSIRLALCSNCDGNNDYMEQINDIFKEVKWGVSGPVMIYGNFKGVSIEKNNSKTADIVFEAFRAAGIPIYYSPSSNVDIDDAVIVVGTIK